MSWKSAVETATQLVEAQKKRVMAANPEDADAIIRSSAKLVHDQSASILTLLRAHDSGLADRLTIAFDIFESFARTPAYNQIRLVNLIDDHLRILLLELRRIVARTGTGQRAAFEVLPPS